jgi:hypothetical protein
MNEYEYPAFWTIYIFCNIYLLKVDFYRQICSFIFDNKKTEKLTAKYLLFLSFSSNLSKRHLMLDCILMLISKFKVST